MVVIKSDPTSAFQQNRRMTSSSTLSSLRLPSCANHKQASDEQVILDRLNPPFIGGNSHKEIAISFKETSQIIAWSHLVVVRVASGT